MKKISKLPPKKQLDYERPVQRLSAKKSHGASDGDVVRPQDEVKGKKKGKFLRNSKGEESRSEQVREDVVEAKSSQSQSEPVERLVQKLDPEVVAVDESELGGGARLQGVKIKTPSPSLAQLIEKEEVIANDVEEGWHEQKTSIPLGWFILLGVIICGVSAWAVLDMWKAQSKIREASVEKQLLTGEAAKDIQEGRDALADMQDCVRGYLAAGSVEIMISYVRHPERVGPLMREYYDDEKNKRWRRKFKRFEHLRAVALGNKSFVLVQAVTEAGSHQNLFLEQLENGDYRVDWESDVVYQPMLWSEYLSKRPVAPMDMRVKVQADDFYGFSFRDSSRYQCYKLTTLGSDDYLFGYVERGSEVAQQIEQLLGSLAVAGREDASDTVGSEDIDDELALKLDELEDSFEMVVDDEPVVRSKPEPMILRIRFLRDDPSKRCVMIDALVANRWMYENSPE